MKKDWNFICHDCAYDLGGFMAEDAIATFHMGNCDKCKKWKSLTEPRDYSLNTNGTKRRKMSIEETLLALFSIDDKIK